MKLQCNFLLLVLESAVNNMAVFLILSLFPLAFACIAIAIRYVIEHQKPPGTRRLPGPWVGHQVIQNNLLGIGLTLTSGLPYIGKIHGTPMFYVWYQMHAWAKQYGHSIREGRWDKL